MDYADAKLFKHFSNVFLRSLECRVKRLRKVCTAQNATQTFLSSSISQYCANGELAGWQFYDAVAARFSLTQILHLSNLPRVVNSGFSGEKQC
jgi:hypothetical protein